MKKEDLQQIQLDRCRASEAYLEARILFLENILFQEIPYLYRRTILQELKETKEDLRKIASENKRDKGKKNAKK